MRLRKEEEMQSEKENRIRELTKKGVDLKVRQY